MVRTLPFSFIQFLRKRFLGIAVRNVHDHKDSVMKFKEFVEDSRSRGIYQDPEG